MTTYSYDKFKKPRTIAKELRIEDAVHDVSFLDAHGRCQRHNLVTTTLDSGYEPRRVAILLPEKIMNDFLENGGLLGGRVSYITLEEMNVRTSPERGNLPVYRLGGPVKRLGH